MKLRIPALLLILASCLFAAASGQVVVQYEEPAGEPIVLTESISIPAEPPGYTLVLPDLNKPVNGLIVFFHADRDTAGKMFRLSLPYGIAVLFVTTGNRLEFFFDEDRLLQIESYIASVVDRNRIPRDHLLFAGMSLAGTRAAKFTRFASSSVSRHQLVPRALVLCDAPLDFVRFWNEMNKAKQVGATPVTANEAAWVTGYLEKNLGGTPTEVPGRYEAYSPYFHGPPAGDGLEDFCDIDIRAYAEPDVLWWMSTRKKDYYAMNAIDMAGLINDLSILNCERAELIVTTDKGYLPDGTRHPHSWSIVDESELVDWFAALPVVR
ncbi:MAG: hypothetical protein OEV30_00295 [Ignavibacteria bacterium]|nr:hypothetical protein [Ignavibacteria bacterium]